MKKLLVGFILASFLFVLTGCGQTTTILTTLAPTTPTTEKTYAQTYWDQDANGIEDWQEQEITLNYSSWQHTSDDIVTIESLMAQAFTEKYPNITINIQLMGASSEEWDSNFIAAAESDTLPDVFLVNRLASFLPYNILMDISDMYAHDPDTNAIFDSLEELGTYEGKRYAIPTQIYPVVWVVNTEILEAAGVAIPTYDWTYQQLEAIARATTNENTHIIGMYGCSFYNRELPKILKIQAAGNDAEQIAYANTWRSYSFDGTKFNFNDPVFLTAMTMLVDAIEGGYCVRELSAETRNEWYLDSAFEPTYNGKVAVWREASWSLKNHFSEMLFEWDVYPGPNGVMGGNTDIAGIASSCDYPQAAYQFLKWMSYSEEGLLTRFDLFEKYADQVYISANNYGYPVADYGIDGTGHNVVWEAIPYNSTAEGFVSPQFIEALRNGAYWTNKETVGWDEADSVAYTYIYQTEIGETTYAAIKDTLYDEANAAMQTAIATLNALIDQLN